MDRFFLLPGVDAPSLLPYGTYDPMLVVLSVCLAIFASTMALHATEQARVLTQSSLRSVTLLAGSLALGCGVWGMHFIGMLAYQLCTTVTYDSDLTTASVLPSVAASWVALRMRVTYAPGMDRSTAMSMHSWVKSSAMVRHLMRRPLASESLTKSRLQV